MRCAADFCDPPVTSIPNSAREIRFSPIPPSRPIPHFVSIDSSLNESASIQSLIHNAQKYTLRISHIQSHTISVYCLGHIGIRTCTQAIHGSAGIDEDRCCELECCWDGCN
eukprot:453683_1